MLKKTNAKAIFAGILVFLSVLGPGIITGSVDNDAGGITTYSVAGATYGYDILWTLVPALIVLIVIQEMNARMGIVTGKGLADLIRENAGVKVTFFIFIFLVIADIGNTTTEFAGVAGSMQALGVSKYVAVPLSAVVVWLLVVKGTYKSVEKIFLVFSVFLLSYIASALMGKPDWSQIGHAMVHPDAKFDFDYIVMVIGIVGTTIAPWMQFYMQSSVIEKGLTLEKYKYTVVDVVVGAIITVVVAFFIIVACAATLHVKGIQDRGGQGRGHRPRPPRGQGGSHHFRGGPLRGLDFLGDHPPDRNGLLCLRSLRIRGRHRQEVEGSPAVLLAFHHHRDRRSRDNPSPQGAPHTDHDLDAGLQRRPPTGGPHLHANHY